MDESSVLLTRIGRVDDSNVPMVRLHHLWGVESANDQTYGDHRYYLEIKSTLKIGSQKNTGTVRKFLNHVVLGYVIGLFSRQRLVFLKF